MHQAGNFSGDALVIAIGKEAVASAVSDTGRQCRCNDCFPLCCRSIYFFLH